MIVYRIVPALAAILAMGVGGCEEKRAERAPAGVTPGAQPAVSLASEPRQVPAPKPKPRKKLEDCPLDTVIFPTAGFEEAVRKKAQKPTGTITSRDLAQLRSLDLSQIELDDLDICIFHHMTGLTSLYLGRGQIEDLSPIASATKLETLRASLNPVADLQPLRGMTKMDRLDLASTNVGDLTPLEAMTELTELLLDDTPVSDVTALGKLTKLRVLVLKNTRVKDLKPLKPLKKLVALDIRGTPVEDATVVMRPGLRIEQY